MPVAFPVLPRGPALRLLYLGTFVFLGGYANFFPVWLRDVGWDEPAIGWLDGARYACVIAFPLLWGHLADRWGDPVRALLVIWVGGLVAFAPTLVTASVAPLFASLTVYAAFRAGTIPTTDALALAHVRATGEAYGAYRVWGSAGFIAGGLALGGLVAAFGRPVVPPALFVVMVGGVLTVVAMRRRPGDAPSATPDVGALRTLWRDPALRALLAVAFASRLALQGVYGFLPLHLADLGVSDGLIPVFWSVGVLSEVVLMRAFPRLFGHRSPRAVLTFCLLAAAAQLGLTAALRDPWAVLAVMTLHGITFGVWYVQSLTWLGRHVPPGSGASAQALFQSVGFGLGSVLSAVAAGYLFDRGGGPLMFGVAAVAALAGAAYTWRRFPADAPPPRLP